VLLVDDTPALAREVAQALRDDGGEVLLAGTVNEAFAALIDARLDLAVIDLELPGESGLQILQQLKGPDERPVAVVMLTDADTPQARTALLEAGADDVLSRPAQVDELLARCRRARRQYGQVRGLEGEARRLHELSMTDGLTQVANHRAFQDRLKDEFRRAQRYDDPLALILVDVDHFKKVNDQHGHPVGDEVLRRLADALRLAVRETDFVARYGGEEFAALLPKTHLAGALTVAERISLDVKQLRSGPAAVRITASFGVSSFPGRAINTAEQLLRTADEALYRSKREGRDKISLYQVSVLAPSTS
jgi:diguanylate cyclase (GGDEF)-like protein